MKPILFILAVCQEQRWIEEIERVTAQRDSYRAALEDIRQKDSVNLQMGGYRKGSFGHIADIALDREGEPPCLNKN